MRKLLEIAVPLCSVFVFLTGVLAQGQRPQHREKPNVVFVQVLGEILAKSSVPSELPAYLPYVNRQNPVYLASISIGKSGYNLMLAFDPHCEGQHECYYASFEGNVSPFEPLDKTGIPVILRDGIRGEFYDSECGSYCDGSYIRWSERGFYYSISMTGETKSMLIRVANSAIQATSR